MGQKTMQFQEIADQLGFYGRPNPKATISIMRPQITKSLEIRDRQQFIQRYKWITLDGSPLPNGFDPDIVERILYYRYKLIAFMYDDGEGMPKLYTTPFALAGEIDVYGRYKKVSPLTFNGAITYKKDTEGNDTEVEDHTDDSWITDLELVPTYSMYDTQPTNIDGKVYDRCVILQDFTNGISQNETPRYKLSQEYIRLETDIISLIRHDLISSARIYSLRVTDEGMKNTAQAELDDMEEEILENGKIFFPITSAVTLDTVFDDKQLDTQEYWECFVSMDNLRENLMGIENNGIFNKKERELQGEAEKEASQSDLVYADGLAQRQKFCEILDVTFGLNLWCVESNAIDKVDVNDDNYDTDEETENETEQTD